jgi:hypothetical protein
MDINVVLSHVVLGAILGMVGQSARVVIGLKKVLDQANSQGRTFSEEFSANVLVVSLIIGAVAGVLAVIAAVGLDSQLITKEALLAVIAAGYDQLKQDRKPTDNLNRAMGADLKYDGDGIGSFLSLVRQRLADSTPPYKFQFDSEFADNALEKSVIDLIAAVGAKTDAA